MAPNHPTSLDGLRCAKRTCGQIASCDEAMQYVQQCGSSGIDGDGDGVPCESLCR